MLRKICEMTGREVPFKIAPDNFENKIGDSEETLRRLIQTHYDTNKKEIQKLETIFKVERACNHCKGVKSHDEQDIMI